MFPSHIGHNSVHCFTLPLEKKAKIQIPIKNPCTALLTPGHVFLDTCVHPSPMSTPSVAPPHQLTYIAEGTETNKRQKVWRNLQTLGPGPEAEQRKGRTLLEVTGWGQIKEGSFEGIWR